MFASRTENAKQNRANGKHASRKDSRRRATRRWYIVETRKIVALLRTVLRSANRHVPERRNQFIIARSRYRCRAFRSETRAAAHNENIAR